MITVKMVMLNEVYKKEVVDSWWRGYDCSVQGSIHTGVLQSSSFLAGEITVRMEFPSYILDYGQNKGDSAPWK